MVSEPIQKISLHVWDSRVQKSSKRHKSVAGGAPTIRKGNKLWMSRKRKHVICKGVGHPSPSIPGSTTPVSAPGSTVPVQQPTPVSVPGSTVPVQQPTPVSVPGSTASLQQPNPVCAHTSTVPTTMSQSTIQPTLVLNYTTFCYIPLSWNYRVDSSQFKRHITVDLASRVLPRLYFHCLVLLTPLPPLEVATSTAQCSFNGVGVCIVQSNAKGK